MRRKDSCTEGEHSVRLLNNEDREYCAVYNFKTEHKVKHKRDHTKGEGTMILLYSPSVTTFGSVHLFYIYLLLLDDRKL